MTADCDVCELVIHLDVSGPVDEVKYRGPAISLQSYSDLIPTYATIGFSSIGYFMQSGSVLDARLSISLVIPCKSAQV
jgi:hypothetical protein